MLEENSESVHIDAICGHVNDLVSIVHVRNKNWWIDIKTMLPIKRNVGELLCLVHSEISEAMEGDRKNLMDDKLPNRKMLEVELGEIILKKPNVNLGEPIGIFKREVRFNQ